MSTNEVITMRDELLDRMVEEFNEVRIAAEIADNEGTGAPKMVRAFLDEVGDIEGVMGEYYFSPMSSEDDQIQIFNALITLSEEVPEDNLPALFEAMSYINFYVPIGAFSLNKDHTFLCFRLSVSIPTSYDEDAVYGLMSAAAGNSASIVDKYMPALMDVVNNKLSVDEIMDMLGGRRKS